MGFIKRLFGKHQKPQPFWFIIKQHGKLPSATKCLAEGRTPERIRLPVTGVKGAIRWI